ncbi:periplasmic substrate-binding domain-containing protein [Pontibacillus litoralis]|uniref:Solute-binding protein family 5 domain-containing protein n=1 Tax=Pontibacillus litoralis JSM 072002 TaxID=1385512 RepID=A0A0A5FUY9_9BACI|nr:hypothetical protein [Pontibacillus litoralis]KGX84586.1 hypothetical protein N784_13115 [Pontibacillus litoralis JSM 072002]
MKNLRTAKKSKEEVIIEIDSLPFNFNPLMAIDYNSKLVASTMYEPLISDFNCHIEKNISQGKYFIRLYDSYRATTRDIYNTILYHLNKENGSPYKKELLPIKGAMNYIKKVVEVDQLGVHIEDDKNMCIELEHDIDYFEHVLEGQFLVPSTGEGIPINTGPYKMLHTTDTSISLERNDRYHLTTECSVKLLTFLLNQDIYRSMHLYLQGKVDITCNTQFFHENEWVKDYEDFQEYDLSLLYSFEINRKNTGLKNLIMYKYPRSEVSKHVYGNLKPINNLLGEITKNVTYDQDPEFASGDTNTVSIIYADYYPNHILVDRLKIMLENLELKTKITRVEDFKEYVTMDKTRYDIKLHLFLPNYDHLSSFFKFFINDIESASLRRNLVDLYNNRNRDELIRCFESTTHYIPLFLGKSQYLKDPHIKGFKMNRIGLLSVAELSYEN